MREVEIRKPGFLVNTKNGIPVLCPETFNFPHDEKEALYCNTDCAWYTEREGTIHWPDKADTTGMYACCKEHCIGKIKNG